MPRFLALLSITVFSLSFAGCGGDDEVAQKGPGWRPPGAPTAEESAAAAKQAAQQGQSGSASEGDAAYGDGFDPAGGPPPGERMDDDAGYGEGFDPAGGPPPGERMDDDPGYGEGFDPAGGRPPGEQMDDDPGYGAGFDPAGGRPPGERMDDDGGYGEGFDPAGGPPAGEGGGEGDSYAGGEGRGGNDPAGRKPEAKPEGEGLLGKAEKAFAEGNEAEAMAWVYAAALTGETNHAETLKWIPGLTRPSLGVRWAIGLDVAPDDFEGNPYPVGTTQNIPERESGGRSRDGFEGYPGGGGEPDYAGDGGPYGSDGGGVPSDVLARYTGELSQKLLDHLDSTLGTGEHGELLKRAHALVGLRRGLKADIEPQPIMGGVTFLGMGSFRKLQTLAEEQGIDVLVMYNVSLKKNRRNEVVTNTTRVMVYDVQRGERPDGWGRFKTMTNVAVQLDRKKEGERKDPVDSEFESLFGEFNTMLKGAALPEGLKPEHVAGRIAQIVSSPPKFLPTALAEIKYYQTAGFADEQQVKTAFQTLLGEEDGARLAVGSAEEKLQAMSRFLPGAGAQ